MTAWRDIIRRFDAEFGAGAARRELALFGLAAALWAIAVLGVAVLVRGGGQ